MKEFLKLCIDHGVTVDRPKRTYALDCDEIKILLHMNFLPMNFILAAPENLYKVVTLKF